LRRFSAKLERWETAGEGCRDGSFRLDAGECSGVLDVDSARLCEGLRMGEGRDWRGSLLDDGGCGGCAIEGERQARAAARGAGLVMRRRSQCPPTPLPTPLSGLARQYVCNNRPGYVSHWERENNSHLARLAEEAQQQQQQQPPPATTQRSLARTPRSPLTKIVPHPPAPTPRSLFGLSNRARYRYPGTHTSPAPFEDVLAAVNTRDERGEKLNPLFLKNVIRHCDSSRQCCPFLMHGVLAFLRLNFGKFRNLACTCSPLP
jgi:hypothetical protein